MEGTKEIRKVGGLEQGLADHVLPRTMLCPAGSVQGITQNSSLEDKGILGFQAALKDIKPHHAA